MIFFKLARVSTVLTLVLGLVAGCSVSPLSPPTYEQNIRSVISRGTVYINVQDDGTVILSGWVEDPLTRQLVLNEARKGEGVTRVINRLWVAR